MSDDIAIHDQIVVEPRRLPRKHITSAFEEFLVLDQPRVPRRSASVCWLNGSLAVGNRIRRIRNIDFGFLGVVRPGLIEQESLALMQIELRSEERRVGK